MTKRIYRIKAYSTGGQGVKSMITKISKELSDKYQLKITSLVHYDSIVKGGLVDADLVVSNYEINSPFIETADLCIILAEMKEIIKSESYIVSEDLKEKYKYPESIYLPFNNETEDLKEIIFAKVLEHFSIEK